MSSNCEEDLKKLILKKCGIDTVSVRDCRMISERIFEQDKNYLSESTLKRFFGFLDPPSSFSPFVKDALCIFLGYGSFQQFNNEWSKQHKC